MRDAHHHGYSDVHPYCSWHRSSYISGWLPIEQPDRVVLAHEDGTVMHVDACTIDLLGEDPWTVLAHYRREYREGRPAEPDARAMGS
jgi:hypothetical protein